MPDPPRLEILQPGTLAEALELKAERPDARAARGRHRPHGRAQLPPRPARRGARPHARPGAARVGAGRRPRAGRGRRHVHAADRGAGRPPAGPGDREPHRRLAADPQPRDGRRQPRHGLARPATACRRSTPSDAVVEVASTRGSAPDPGRRVRDRAEAHVPGRRRADRRLRPAPPPTARSSSPRSARATRW